MGCLKKNIISSVIRSVLRVALPALLFSCFRLDAQVPDSSRINLGFPVYSQYLQNGMVINPAYTGTREVLSGTLSYRMQWMGTSGSPLLQSLAVHSPMKNDKVALGMTAQFMKYGATRSTSLYGSYAYHIKLRRGKVSMGLKAGVDLSNTDYTGLLLNDPGIPFSSRMKNHLFCQMPEQEFTISPTGFLQGWPFRHFLITGATAMVPHRHITISGSTSF